MVYADATLTEAWRKVRTGTDLAGVDGMTVSQFQARLFANLKALQQLLRSRRYIPQPAKRLSMLKADGTRRPLGILTVTDRIVQRAVLQVIEPLFEAQFEECSHGFRKGRSIQTAITQVTRLMNHGSGWVVDLDIASCFEQIQTARLFKYIKTTIKDEELRRIIKAWLDIETVTVERAGFLHQATPRGLLQGGILSPLFANIYLDRFDKMARKHGLKLVRYADDCVICCRSQEDAEAALALVKKLLARLDLDINPRKTAIYHIEKGLHYLGEQLFLKKQGAQEHVVVLPQRRKTATSPPLLLAKPSSQRPAEE
jgi:group II intron reverse transcriptase/maturase